MATRVERTVIEACISKVNTAIDELNQAAADINASMEELPNIGKVLLTTMQEQPMKRSTRIENCT